MQHRQKVVLLPSTNEAGAIALAEKLRRVVESTPMQLGKHRVPVTISLGVAACNTVCEECHPDFDGWWWRLPGRA